MTELASSSSPLPRTLDDRRPRSFQEIVGHEQIVKRLTNAARRGFSSPRFALIGPTGSGKTTLSLILARLFRCEGSHLTGDFCGDCRICKMTDFPSSDLECMEWTGARLGESWSWWLDEGKSWLNRPDNCIFIDEIQDLPESCQKNLFRDFEKAKCMLIIATTHEHKVNDALWGRFGTNKFYLKRPSKEQAISSMQLLCTRLGVTASAEQLARVACHFQSNMRLCQEFVYTVWEQADHATVDEEFLTGMIGDQSIANAHTVRRQLSEL